MSRPLPSSPETERFVLGLCLTSEQAMHDCRGSLSRDHFSTEAHRRIWECACAVYDDGKRPDLGTVPPEIMRRGWLESVEGMTGLAAMTEGIPRLSVDPWIAELNDCRDRRALIHMATSLADRAYSGGERVSDLMAAAGQAMAREFSDPRKQFMSLADVIGANGAEGMLGRRSADGVPLPWPRIQGYTCGLHPEQLVILSAATSIGKTSAALQIALNAAERGVGVAVYSLEMGAKSLTLRMAYQHGRVSSERHRHGCLEREERAALSRTLRRLKELPIHIEDSGACSMAEIQSSLRRLMLKHSIGLVIVDYLQILRVPGRESRNNEVGANTRCLKLLAKELRIPFLVLSQLSRKPGREKREPELSDLRDSGEIEQHADTVLFLHRLSADGESPIRVRIKVAKQREGPRGVGAEAIFFPEYQSLSEISRDEEQAA